jgi:hypothetical protein
MDNLQIESAIVSIYFVPNRSDDVDLHQLFASRLGVSRHEAKTILYKHLYSCPFFRKSLAGEQH